ncbi:tail fiber assembly protein [Scandinavium hiltneri]|uniref:tail fiber assembly protein n=1 Tax=Scandinavium hiltneri TaxID=2926519 RepID=UPI0021658305
MTYAVVSEGIVINVVEWDGESEWRPEIGEAIQITGACGIDWSYADGVFTSPPLPEPTHDEFVAQADAQQQQLIDQANAHMNSKQWPGKAAIGRLKGDELAQYNAWLDYLDALEAVDTSSAPDIEWPTQPA